MSEALTEQEIREILAQGHSISDEDWVRHTREHSLRTVYHMCEALRVSAGRLMSFRDLHDIFRKNLRTSGHPPPPDGFNPVDHVSALWYLYEKRNKLEGDFIPAITELLDRSPEDRKTNSKYNYSIRYKYHAVVSKIFDELNGLNWATQQSDLTSPSLDAPEIRTSAPAAGPQPSRPQEGGEDHEPVGSPEPVVDEVVLANILSRRGQQKFRATLLVAYNGACAVTGCNTIAVLEAAHIIPHSEQPSYAVNGGILLRADVHTLFDLFLISIDPERGVVVVSDECKPAYAEFDGAAIALPKRPAERPDSALLMVHFQRCKQRING